MFFSSRQAWNDANSILGVPLTKGHVTQLLLLEGWRPFARRIEINSNHDHDISRAEKVEGGGAGVEEGRGIWWSPKSDPTRS